MRIAVAALAYLLIAAGGCPSALAQAADKVRVDFSGDASAALALFVANNAKFYAKENLQVFLVGKNRAQEISGPHVRLRHASLAEVGRDNRGILDLRMIATTSRKLTGVVASFIDLDEKRDILIRFLRATIEGNYLAHQDQVRAKAVLARDLGLRGARAIDSSYRTFRAQSLRDMDISIPDVENALKIMTGRTHLKASVYVDVSLLSDLHASGFFEAMRKKYEKR
jgi:ABC-type nitrate/sulfonate/bicarbonate transport system substrate-binding protein